MRKRQKRIIHFQEDKDKDKYNYDSIDQKVFRRLDIQ